MAADMKGFTAEEIAKSLRVCTNPISCSGRAIDLTLEKPCSDMLREQAADLIEAQADRIGSLEDELAKLREENRWIPVEEQLPDKFQTVLIFDGDVDAAWFSHGAFQTIDQYESDIISGVTHWKPLPKGPEVGHE